MSGRVLVADIGGTNARLALAEEASGGIAFPEKRTYPSAAFDSLGDLVRRFLDDVGADRPRRAGIAVACPILRGRCRPPNLGWTIDAEGLGETIGVPVARLLNDFDAVGRALPHLSADDLHTVRAGEPEPGGAMAALGAGTGLGIVTVLPGGDRVRIVSSEGGHADFAPRDEEQWALWRFLRARHADRSGGHVSCERVLSGSGLLSLYDFLVGSGRAAERPETRRRFAEADPGRVLSDLAAGDRDPAARAVFDLFFDVFGAVAGNVALTAQARGGVYLAGGIAMENRGALERSRFIEAFDAKGRLREFLEPIPIHLIVRDDVGLLGAAYAALDR